MYEKSKAPGLSEELFKNPGCEYRGAPFWAWNCKLDKDELLRQIEVFKKMGFGGYHMHPRVGLATEYLGDEFMDMIKACVEKGKSVDMNSYLYDEDRWPSGAAGGIVTKNKRLRGKYLIFTREKRESVSFDEMYEAQKPYLYAAYDVELDKDGRLVSYKFYDGGDAEGTVWYAYLYVNEDDSWYNDQAYVDTLAPEAMDEFIRVTYERYLAAVGDDFGGRVPSIFCDEPQFNRNRVLPTPFEGEARRPWTEALPDAFEKAYGKDLRESLPETFFVGPDGMMSAATYHYLNCVSDLFAAAFARRCGEWCASHGLALTGHLMAEGDLIFQTEFVGDSMRSYPYFGIPGIDMLCDNREFNTAKQCQSVVHQTGKEGMLSELYGVTSWDYDFKHHKSQGDWQAALGVTLRVPHLSMVSMKGEAKRDYPASINYQSPWYAEYPLVEDHFARVNAAMTRGEPDVNIAVIHPVESIWMLYGPSSQMLERGRRLERCFADLTRWLLYGSADFDFVNEALLPELYGGCDGGFKVGRMKYSVVIVPSCVTLRKTTLDALREFASKGGKVIFAGDIPEYLNAQPSGEVKAFAETVDRIPFDRIDILKALEPYKDADLKLTNGLPADELITAMRKDGAGKWLFIAHGERLYECARLPERDIVISVRGEYEPTLYDTVIGQISKIPFEIRDGRTYVPYHLLRTDSVLLRLDENVTVRRREKENEPAGKTATLRIFDKVAYRRAEPNVLLLDRAEYSLNGADFEPEEEILRLDCKCRDALGWQRIGGAMTQPWVVPPAAPTDSLTLRFGFDSEIAVDGVRLALENAADARIVFNGSEVEPAIDGYFVDRDIPTVALPTIVRGKNTLTVTLPFGRRVSTEWCYILGEFNVRVEGCKATLTAPTDKIGFGSICSQGMPFYGGNIYYSARITTPAGNIKIRMPHVKGALARVSLDGRDLGCIAYAPFTVDGGSVAAGEHELEILFYGNRFNSFGPLHSLRDRRCIGPDQWRSSGDDWEYEYNLNPTGVMDSPEIIVGIDE